MAFVDGLATTGVSVVDGEAVPVPEQMDAEEFQQIVREAIEDAVDYIDTDIAEARKKATAYFNGEPFGTEEDGRSHFVVREVQDAVRKTMPSVMRVFTQGEDVVEYVPTDESDVPVAEQATDYINYVFQQDNQGYLVLSSVFEDALVRKTGVIKWWTDVSYRVAEDDYEGLTGEQIAMLQSDPLVQIVGGAPVQSPEGEALYNIHVRRIDADKRTRVVAMPPEELLISREAISLETADLVAHRSLRTVSELVEMGYDLDALLEIAPANDDFGTNTERQQRQPGWGTFDFDKSSRDPSMRRLLYVEAYIRADVDGDGIAEMRRVCTVGPNYEIVRNDVHDGPLPFAIFTPFPVPHTVIGASLADQVMDVQEVKSEVLRDALDSLKQSITPRMAVDENSANLDDALNVEAGAIIRTKGAPQSAIMAVSTPYVGAPAMQMVSYFDAVSADRTGITDVSQGLDPKSLHSSTATGVDASVAAAQARVEIICRNFAEIGMRQLFKGLLREIIRNQDKPRIVRLRGKYITVDPRDWRADMDVNVTVGLGRGTDSARMQYLMQVKQTQEQIIQQFGPLNPLVSVEQYRNTLEQITNLAGFRDVGRFFREVSSEQLAQFMEQQRGPQKPDPAELLTMAQAQAIQNEFVLKTRELELKEKALLLEDDRQRDKNEGELYLKAYLETLKLGGQPPLGMVQQVVNAPRQADQAAIMAQVTQGLSPNAGAMPPPPPQQGGARPGPAPGQGGAPQQAMPGRAGPQQAPMQQQIPRPSIRPNIPLGPGPQGGFPR